MRRIEERQAADPDPGRRTSRHRTATQLQPRDEPMTKMIHTPGLLLLAALAAPLGGCVIGQGARQADRHQPQCHDPAGSAGAAAARRRESDQPEPAGLPAAAAAMRGYCFLFALALARWRPLLAQSPAVDAARAQGRLGERYDGYHGRRRHRPRRRFAARSRQSTSSAARSIQQPCREQAAPARRTSGLPRAASCWRGSRSARPICSHDGAWRRRAAGAAPPVPDYCR